VSPTSAGVGVVQLLARHPVKSVAGEVLDAVEVDERGVVGDRVWAVRTPDGKLGSGKTTRRFERVEGLLSCRASGWPDPVLELPDGTAVPVADPGAAAALGAALGRPLVLQREAEVSHFDDAPVHLLSTASLRALAAEVGEEVDPRRFRGNVVVDVPGEGWAEDGWVGARLRLGEEVVLEVVDRMPRCAMVSMAQRDLGADPRVLASLARGHDADLGVQARVVAGGRLRVGDAVRLDA
jgi:uncharacterized protein